MSDEAAAPLLVALWNNGIDRLSTGRFGDFMASVEARNGEKQFGNQWAGTAWFDGEPAWRERTERIYDTWQEAMAALNTLIEPHGFRVLPSAGCIDADEAETSARKGGG